MKKYCKTFIKIMALTTVFMGCTYNYYSSTPTDYGNNPSNSVTGFIKADGRTLRTENGTEYKIKSMGLGNDAYDNECTSIPLNHHNEESYRELAEMGFNTVRFYLTYKWFEDDSNPGTYKEEPFNWINKNIQWADRYNMHILLDMHIPQGGYQSTGKGLALFTDSRNQSRLANLWKEIACRYKDCSTIIGYDIVNEPQVPFDTNIRKSVDSWTALARKCVSSIRSVDTNHVIFAERITGIRGGSSGWYEPDPVYAYPELDDSNVVYQGHFYKPFEFTHQRAYWEDKYKNLKANYTSSMLQDIGEPQWIMEKTTRFDSDSKILPLYWKKFTFALKAWDSTRVNKVRPAIKTGELGRIGSLYIDDVVFTKISQDGHEEIISTYSFDTKDEVSKWYFGSEDNSTGFKGFLSSDGNNRNGCLAVSQTQSASWVTAPDLVELESSCIYTVTFYAKFSAQLSSYASYGFDLYHQETSKSGMSEIIETEISNFAEYPGLKNKPLFIGEFGCIHYCFEDVSGAEQYISDAVSVFNKYTVGYNYHDYHEENFGLHLCPSSELPDNNNLNKKLYDILKSVN